MVQVLILPLTSLSPFLDISIISPPSYVTNLNIFSVSLVFCFLNEQNISQIIIACNRLYNQLKFFLFCLNMLCFSFVFHLSCHLFEMVFIPPFVGGDVTGTEAWTLHHINNCYLTIILILYVIILSHAMLQLVIPAICTLCTTLISSLSSGIA